MNGCADPKTESFATVSIVVATTTINRFLKNSSYIDADCVCANIKLQNSIAFIR